MAGKLAYKRTARNRYETHDLPPGLITTFCSVCGVECCRDEFRPATNQVQAGHNLLMGHGPTAEAVRKVGVVALSPRELCGRPACEECFASEYGDSDKPVFKKSNGGRTKHKS